LNTICHLGNAVIRQSVFLGADVHIAYRIICDSNQADLFNCLRAFEYEVALQQAQNFNKGDFGVATKKKSKKKKSVGRKASSRKKSAPKSKARSKVKAKSKAKAKTKSKAKTKTKPKAKAKPKAKTKSKAKTKIKPKAKAKPKAKTKSKAKTKIKPKAKAKVKSKTKAKTALKPKTKAKSSKKATSKPKQVKLNPTTLKIRDQLLRNQTELLNIIQSSQSIERNSAEMNFSNEIDMASSLEGREMMFQLTSRDRNELKMIKEALYKIETGTYGICESCSKKISAKRLQILPLSILCIDCKESMEHT
jgi:DnaK suppressor protein